MPFIILPHRWRRQPAHPVGIDWSHPAAFGLKNALSWGAWATFDSVSATIRSTSAAFGSLSFSATPYGTGLYTANGSAAAIALAEDWSGPSTTVWQCYINSVDSGWGGLWSKNTTGTSTQLGIGRNSTSDDWYIGKADSGTQTLTSSSITSGIGNYRTFALVNAGSAALEAASLYENGALTESSSINANQNTGAGSLYLGCERSASATYDSDVVWLSFFRWNRALSASEIAAIGNWPQQIYAPITPRRVYFAGAGAGTNVSAGAGSLTVTGYAPTLKGGNRNVASGVGALTVTGLAPTVTKQVRVATNVGAMTVTGYAPVVSLVFDKPVSAGVGALSIAGQAPTVTTQKVVSTWVGAIALAGKEPTAQTTTAGSVATGVGALAITGYAPTVVAPKYANAGVGALSITGYAPTVQVVTYDYLNADSDVTDGNWVKSTDNNNTDLYTMLDEATPDDSDYIKTSTLDDECEIGLEGGNVPSIPGYMTLQIKVPSGFSPVGTLTVTLMDGASQVQQWASQSVSAGQLLELAVTESIGSYSDLRVRLKATA